MERLESTPVIKSFLPLKNPVLWPMWFPVECELQVFSHSFAPTLHFKRLAFVAIVAFVAFVANHGPHPMVHRHPTFHKNPKT
jgi:hypothetical protein